MWWPKETLQESFEDGPIHGWEHFQGFGGLLFKVSDYLIFICKTGRKEFVQVGEPLFRYEEEVLELMGEETSH